MEFLFEYGLFLLKTVTIVVAIGVVISFVVAAGMRTAGHKEKGKIKVTQLNDRYDDMASALRESAFEQSQMKAWNKALKKQAKLDKKQEKNAKQTPSDRKKRVYVLDFNGDIKASATDELREAITAVLSLAEPQDEVVVTLESQGGMVHSYGLAASQLARITAKNIPLTVCVDKVAASGGYMMACVANKILAAPFAIIGSIGVVAQLPNFHKVLKKHDVEYELLTAGEYKRTLTLFGENTEKGRQKFIEDLEDTHELFKDFISEHRTGVKVDDVATGEIWFGSRALDNNLIDAISTSDEYLTAMHPEADLLAVCYEHKKAMHQKLGAGLSYAAESLLVKMSSIAGTRYWSR